MASYTNRNLKNPEMQKWESEIEAAKKFRNKVADYERWEDWKKYYRNDYGDGILPVNLIFSVGRSIIPRVYFRNPQVSVLPLKPNMRFHARIVEELDNWLVRQVKFKQTMKKTIQDSYLTGTGLIKLGYDSEFGYDPSLEVSEPEPVGWELDPYAEPRREYDSRIHKGMPWALRVPGRDFLVPWGCEGLETAEWVAHRYMRRVEDVKKDPMYSNTRNLKGSHNSLWVKDDASPSRLYMPKEEDEYIELWEIYDKRERKIKVIATGHDKFLRNDKDELYMGNVPFESLVFNDDGDYFWGISDCKIIEPQQMELNEIRTQYREHRKLALIKMLLDESAINPDEMEKLANGDIGTIIKVLGNPREVAHILSPHIPPDLMLAAREVRQDIRETVGFSRNQMGEFDDSTRRTATEASIVQQASSIRVDERRDVTADLFAQCVSRMNGFIFQNWTGRHVVQVLGEDGLRQWVSFTGPQIAGDYELRVDPESTLPTTRETRKADAQEIFATLGPIFAQTGNQAGMQELMTFLLENYEGVDPARFLGPTGDSPGESPDNAIPLGEFAGMGGNLDATLPIPMSGMLP